MCVQIDLKNLDKLQFKQVFLLWACELQAGLNSSQLSSWALEWKADNSIETSAHNMALS